MSDMSGGWGMDAFAAAERAPVWSRPAPRHFTPHGADAAPGGFSAWASDPAPVPAPAATPAPAPVSQDMEAVRADAYAQGFNEGQLAAFDAINGEHEAIGRLASAIAAVRTEPPGDLAQVLALAVGRLVRQVVGEVEIDAALMAERTQAIAALAAEDGGAPRLRLHPTDVARVEGMRPDLALVPDPSLQPGSVVAETAGGWIEDGPAIRLEKLNGLLDRMGCRR